MIESVNSYLNNFNSNLSVNKVNFLKEKINNLKNETTKNFQQLLNEKINKDGSINVKKLSKEEKKLYDACIELESFLWKNLLNEMRKTINKYRLLEMSPTENIFTDLLYNEYSLILAKNANTKIADEMFKQLSPFSKLK